MGCGYRGVERFIIFVVGVGGCDDELEIFDGRLEGSTPFVFRAIPIMPQS
jgi:hypothetical protein